MTGFFGVLFDGFAYGMLLFLLSVGLSVTLGMMNFINLAHCSFGMLGGYVTVTLLDRLGWPFFATLPFAFLAGAAASLVLEGLLFRRFYRSDPILSLLLTFGLAMVGLDPNFAFTYLIWVLIVVSVGGLASIGGSFAAAMLLGISDMAGKYYVPALGSFLIYLLMVGLLMWRPAGLFGKR